MNIFPSWLPQGILVLSLKSLACLLKNKKTNGIIALVKFRLQDLQRSNMGIHPGGLHVRRTALPPLRALGRIIVAAASAQTARSASPRSQLSMANGKGSGSEESKGSNGSPCEAKKKHGRQGAQAGRENVHPLSLTKSPKHPTRERATPQAELGMDALLPQSASQFRKHRRAVRQGEPL